MPGACPVTRHSGVVVYRGVVAVVVTALEGFILGKKSVAGMAPADLMGLSRDGLGTGRRLSGALSEDCQRSTVGHSGTNPALCMTIPERFDHSKVS